MNTKISTFVAVCIIALCSPATLTAQAPYGNAGDHTAVQLGSSEAPFGYYEYLPTNFNNDSGEKYPIVVFYHGYGERGNGTTDLEDLLLFGPPKMIEQGTDFEAIMISPQKYNASFSSSDFLNLYNYLKENYPVDLDRVYVTGLSSGGGSAWKAVEGHADKIAAVVPICGASYVNNSNDLLQQTPIWAHHNFYDNVVDKFLTINNVNEIASVGNSVMSVYPYGSEGSAADQDYSMQFNSTTQNWYETEGTNEPVDKLTFTLYKDGGHDSWTKTYNNQEVWDWMFAQSRNGNQLNVNEEIIEFKLYPNPTSDIFTITTKNDSQKNIEIYSTFGKKIYSTQFSRELSVDMSSHSSGVYFAKVIGESKTEKVMKVILN